MHQKKRRYGAVIELIPGKVEEYKKLHAAVWPGVLKVISDCNISNYSIYLKDHLLFSYFEYTGNDYAADMRGMAADPSTLQWWALCKPCMKPLPSKREDEWWADMEEIFHHD